MTEPTDLVERLRERAYLLPWELADAANEAESHCGAYGTYTEDDFRDDDDVVAMSQAADEITALRDRLAALEGALRPFAFAAKWWCAFNEQQRITTLHQHGDCLEVGHLRKARSILSRAQGNEFSLSRQQERMDDVARQGGGDGR